jgi:polyferredoxin
MCPGNSNASAAPVSEPKQKMPLVRRVARDSSQQVRRSVQLAFLLLNVWIAVQFLLWTRSFAGQGIAPALERPAGIDGWLPIAGLMNLKFLLVTHHMPSVHPAALVLAALFLLASVLLKKSFCSWLCPVGTVSESLWKLGRKLFRRNFIVPRWLDLPLRSLKYIRFLCPYGALMGLVSVVSPVRIRRDAEACIDCGKCNKACPSHLPVDRLIQVRSMECTSCMECVAVCPAEDALQFSLPPRVKALAAGRGGVAARWRNRALDPRVVAAALAILFFSFVGVAKATGHWQTNISHTLYQQLVPHADEYGHQEQVP